MWSLILTLSVHIWINGLFPTLNIRIYYMYICLFSVDATYVGPGGDDGNEPSGNLIFCVCVCVCLCVCVLCVCDTSRKHAYIMLTPLNQTKFYSKTGVYRGIYYFSYFCSER